MSDYYQSLYELLVQSRTDFDKAKSGNRNAQRRLRRIFRQFQDISNQAKKFWKVVLKEQPKKTKKQIKVESKELKVYKLILSDIKKWKGIGLGITTEKFIADYCNRIPSLMIQYRMSFVQQDFETSVKKLIKKKLLIVKEDGLLWVSDLI
ncbi:hypothetical protein LCGC14_3009490 [marine sediment metagenome]|uniref:Uncharacterized protein n=1 Tax=marine sediment metagenome TaxID=412755 RepID=A0A0F8WZ46_9ZZZZ